MFTDKFGQIILNENDLCEFYYTRIGHDIKTCLIDNKIENILELDNFPNLSEYIELDCTIEEFDNLQQNNLKMPNYYKTFDIAEYVLELCKTEQELQRAAHELLLFQEKNMFDLLRYLKYLVDIIKENNIVCGVGRGSSVASFVLFLIGVHKINSLYYNLPIEEFIK